MKARILALALLLALAVPVLAADPPAASDDAAKAKAAKLEAVKAEMAKCAVCRNMAAHFDELFPVMQMEIVTLNDGMAMVHTVTDPSKVALFQSTCDAMSTAGEATLKMTDEDAKTQLCPACQEMRSLMKAGAVLSAGHTKNGDLMTITSTDAALQAKIADYNKKCVMMMAEM